MLALILGPFLQFNSRHPRQFCMFRQGYLAKHMTSIGNLSSLRSIAQVEAEIETTTCPMKELRNSESAWESEGACFHCFSNISRCASTYICDTSTVLTYIFKIESICLDHVSAVVEITRMLRNTSDSPNFRNLQVCLPI